jgi:23S rRNA pseudouridine1911/1915/1917 synthase
MEQSIRRRVSQKGIGERIDKFLRNGLRTVSRGDIQIALRDGRLTINRKRVKPGYRLRENDVIAGIVGAAPHAATLSPEAMDLNIVYEDSALLAIDKPGGLVVHPGAGNKNGTLVNGLLFHFGKSLLKVGGEDRPGIVHRLDKDTSGLIIIAKNNLAHAQLSDMFKARKIKKTYCAVVWGEMAGTQVIDRSIGRCRVHREKMRIAREGREAVTRIQVKKSNGWLTELRVQPETGRTHQIRVHLSSIGHPILGDATYGGGRKRVNQVAPLYRQTALNVMKKTGRLMLHAEKLEFEHPLLKKKIRLRAQMPRAMKEVIALI